MNWYRNAAVVLLVFASLLSWPGKVSAQVTRTVTKLADTNDGTCDADCSLREAVAAASADALVDFAPSLAGGTILLGSEVSISRNLTIDGTAAAPIAVSGNFANRVFSAAGGTDLTLRNLTLTGGNTSGSGGLVSYSGGGTLTIDACSLTASGAPSGGALAASGAATSVSISNSTFFANAASGGNGGAIYSSAGSLSVSGTTFKNNSNLAGNGGAIANLDGAVTLINSTFSGNSAGGGGAIYNYASAAATSTEIHTSTFSGNSADGPGGAVLQAATLGPSSTVSLVSSIVAGTLAGANCAGGVAGSYSIDDGTSCGWGTSNSCLSGTDPLLGILGAYDGPTETIPLLPGSPAIDAGDSGDCWDGATVANVDQRGEDRASWGTRCDIGAFESRGFTFTVAGGDGQSALVGAAFAAPLAVSVISDSAGTAEPVDGGAVTFTAPASGAGLSFTGAAAVTVAGGQAALSATANDAKGPYSVTADGAGNSTAALSFALSNTAASTATAIDSHLPSPSLTGEAVTVAVTVSGGPVPTGSVSISGADVNCTATLAAGTGSCEVVFDTLGDRTLTATYGGDGAHDGSTATASHTVNAHPGDWDGDGGFDLLWRNPLNALTAVGYFNGTAYSGSYSFLKPGIPLPWAMAAANDFSGDGSTDIVWRDEASGRNVLARYDGTGRDSYSLIESRPAPWAIFGSADIDGDRRPDLFWTNGSSGQNEVWYMVDKQVAGRESLPPAPAPWSAIGVGDFDGDGKPDLVARNGANGMVAVAYLDGVKRRGVKAVAAANPAWYLCGAMDFSGDGLPDLLWRDPASGANELWTVAGGAVTKTESLVTVSPPWRCMTGRR